jgi:hypothetical protein
MFQAHDVVRRLHTKCFSTRESKQDHCIKIVAAHDRWQEARASSCTLSQSPQSSSEETSEAKLREDHTGLRHKKGTEGEQSIAANGQGSY